MQIFFVHTFKSEDASSNMKISEYMHEEVSARDFTYKFTHSLSLSPS